MSVRCDHRWTIIPSHVLSLAEQVGASDPIWYVGPRTVPYCRACGEKMPGGIEAWNAWQLRSRRREAMWD